MKETKQRERKKINPFTQIGYLLLTKGNRYLNAFFLLAAFALGGTFLVAGINSVGPSFAYAARESSLSPGTTPWRPGSRRGFRRFYACSAWR